MIQIKQEKSNLITVEKSSDDHIQIMQKRELVEVESEYIVELVVAMMKKHRLFNEEKQMPQNATAEQLWNQLQNIKHAFDHTVRNYERKLEDASKNYSAIMRENARLLTKIKNQNESN